MAWSRSQPRTRDDTSGQVKSSSFLPRTIYFEMLRTTYFVTEIDYLELPRTTNFVNMKGMRCPMCMELDEGPRPV